MSTSQKIRRTVFVSLYFDKIFYHANAMDGMYVNAHKKWPSHKFLVCTSLLFNKNIPQVAARATRLQWLKIEQRHRMTSSTWFRGCPTKRVIGHRTWSIIGHSTIIQSNIINLHLSFWTQIIPDWNLKLLGLADFLTFFYQTQRGSLAALEKKQHKTTPQKTARGVKFKSGLNSDVTQSSNHMAATSQPNKYND